MLLRNGRLLAWFFAAVVVLLADAAACYWSVGQLLGTFRHRAESYEAVAALDRVLSTLKDAETGQRGYLLTGDPQYLGPYNAAGAEIGPRLDEAEAHLSDAAQRSQLSALREITRQKLDELALTVALRRDQGFEAAQKVVAENRGERYMEDARRTVDAMQRVERANLGRRQAEAESSTARAFATLGVVIGLNLLLLALAYRSVRAVAAERRRGFEAAARLAAIVETSDDAIVAKNLDGSITSWNQGAERIFGYAAAEIVGKSILTLVPEDRREEEEDFLRRLRAGERIDPCETVRVAKGGRRIDVSLTISPVRDGTGRIIGASKIARDVTSRKAAERELLESYRRLDAVLSSITDGYIVMDNQFRLVQVNPVAERLVFAGRPAAELVGRGFWDDYPQGQTSEFYRQYHRAVEQRVPVHFEARSAISGRWFETHAYPRDGRLEVYLRDVSERREAEERVRQVNQNLERLVAERTAELSSANRQLEEVNEQLEAFNYSVSHDLRAPLRGMQGFAQALLEDYGPRLDDAGRDFARRIAGAARRMDGLIQDLLDYSRLRRQDLPLRPVGVRQAVADALGALDAEAGAAAAVIDADGVGCEITANRPVLAQMLMNLIGNAIKFVRPGATPVVRVWCEDRGPRVRINVRDNGIGVAPDHRDRIFRPFERLHGSEEYPGTGIGLAVVRAGAERMGGACGVEPAGDAPGQGDTDGGSVFWVELPKARADAPKDEDA